jgi:hypothetical protein
MTLGQQRVAFLRRFRFSLATDEGDEHRDRR